MKFQMNVELHTCVFSEKKNDGKCNYAISIVLCHLLKFSTQQIFFCYGYSAGRFTLALADHYTFLGNWPLTPPLSQHFALNEKQVLMLA